MFSYATLWYKIIGNLFPKWQLQVWCWYDSSPDTAPVRLDLSPSFRDLTPNGFLVLIGCWHGGEGVEYFRSARGQQGVGMYISLYTDYNMRELIWRWLTWHVGGSLWIELSSIFLWANRGCLGLVRANWEKPNEKDIPRRNLLEWLYYWFQGSPFWTEILYRFWSRPIVMKGHQREKAVITCVEKCGESKLPTSFRLYCEKGQNSEVSLLQQVESLYTL